MEKLQDEKKRRTVVAGICMDRVVYFAVHFVMLDKLSLWMRDGGIAFLLCLLPAELLILTLLHDLCERVILFNTIFEFFDMSGRRRYIVILYFIGITEPRIRGNRYCEVGDVT